MKQRSPFLASVLLFATASFLLVTGCVSSHVAADKVDEQAEAVNVGYGTTARPNITGAVSTMELDEARHFTMSLEELLKQVSGVNVVRTASGRLKVTVRGLATFHGSNEALYVIDGVVQSPELGEGLPNLDPAEVASIAVLKDSGSAAIYGSRGANGVVLITTRRGGSR